MSIVGSNGIFWNIWLQRKSLSSYKVLKTHQYIEIRNRLSLVGNYRVQEGFDEYCPPW